MTDERLTPDVTSWLKDTDTPTRDLNRSVGRAMTNVQQTRQLGRWWWLPSFARTTASAPITDITTEVQPSPVPATNGSTPTVIRRTQSMFSPAKAITAGALVFAIGGVVLIAQPFDQQGGSVPGAATDGTSQRPATFSGRFESVVKSADYWERFSTRPEDDGSMWYRNGGGVRAGRSEMSDERLSGEVTRTGPSGVDRWGWAGGHGTVEVYFGTLGIENEGGSWHGHRTHIGPDPSVAGAEELVVEFIELVGSGAYEGWSAILYARPEDEEGIWEDWLVYGAVFPGNLPPDRETYLPD